MIKELPVWMMSEWNTIIVVYYLKELSYGKCHKWRSLESHPFLSTYATSGHSCFFYRNICREDIKICKTLTLNTITNFLKKSRQHIFKKKNAEYHSYHHHQKMKTLEMNSFLFMPKPLAIIQKANNYVHSSSIFKILNINFKTSLWYSLYIIHNMFTPHQDSRHYKLISKLRTFPP